MDRYCAAVEDLASPKTDHTEVVVTNPEQRGAHQILAALFLRFEGKNYVTRDGEILAVCFSV